MIVWIVVASVVSTLVIIAIEFAVVVRNRSERAASVAHGDRVARVAIAGLLCAWWLASSAVVLGLRVLAG